MFGTAHTAGASVVDIVPFLHGRVAFDPKDIEAMSMALDDVCKTLNLSDDAKVEREVIALRIIGLARQGERSRQLLRDRILQDSGPIGRNGQPRTGL